MFLQTWWEIIEGLNVPSFFSHHRISPLACSESQLGKNGPFKTFGWIPQTGNEKYSRNVGFEVFTAVVMKSIIFWDMTPCSPFSCTRRFGGTYRLHLQGRRIVQQTSEQAGGKQDTFLQNVGCNSTDYKASYPRRWYSSHSRNVLIFETGSTKNTTFNNNNNNKHEPHIHS
jgi:hypothetical protein